MKEEVGIFRQRGTATGNRKERVGRSRYTGTSFIINLILYRNEPLSLKGSRRTSLRGASDPLAKELAPCRPQRIILVLLPFSVHFLINNHDFLLILQISFKPVHCYFFRPSYCHLRFVSIYAYSGIVFRTLYIFWQTFEFTYMQKKFRKIYRKFGTYFCNLTF